MIDLPNPPFRAGDLAYGAPSPGGYASTAATPTDPQFGGDDDVYNVVPALGGDFQPGSGTPAPNTSPISNGSPADGGAQKIADAPRVDEPAPTPPPTPAELSGSVNGSWVIFVGVASEDTQIDVLYQASGEPDLHVITPILEGDSAAVAAAKVTQRMNEAAIGDWIATQTSNAVQILSPAGDPLPGTLSVTVAPPDPEPEEEE